MNRLQHFSQTIDSENIAIITLNVPDESMNVLSRHTIQEMQIILDEVEKNNQIKGVILVSGKDNSFIAGADIKMISACQSEADAEELAKEGQAIFSRIEKSSIPFVAAIHGVCFGGGLEFVLGCHYRVATDDDSTQFALPEVKLGLLPGSGGTQRLPKLVGIQNALNIMLTGKQIRAKSAFKMGLVDDLVPKPILIETAKNLLLNGLKQAREVKLNLVSKVLEKNSYGRDFLFSQALKAVEKTTNGHYPAPAKIIEAIKIGLEQSHVRGYQFEAHSFGELSQTSQSFQLRQLFLATSDQKKAEKEQAELSRDIQKVAVLGGGLMGGGIAYATAIKAALPVRIKDVQNLGIQNALKYSYDILNKKVKRRFLKPAVAQKQLSLITGTTDYSGFAHRDLVVEAVFEDLTLKQQMLNDIEKHCQENTIFASNTSSLPIAKIAEKAKRPENVVGLHYFSPVDKMPLVEIIPHKGTSEETIATVTSFARKQGKTPIVVKDGAGFYVNRILAIYINEAAHLLLDGEPIDVIDRSLVQFGFPIGPIKLLDEVGIDVGTKIIPILTEAFGMRFESPEALTKVIASGRKGKKNRQGFYNYTRQNKWIAKIKPQPVIDESIYDLLGVDAVQRLNQDEIAERCLMQMLNEAARCYEEKIIKSSRDGDIGAVFGIGFPPFLGGPFRYMDSYGIANVVERLRSFESRFGARYQPAQILLDYEADNKTFYQD